jgi:hypothetical protein
MNNLSGVGCVLAILACCSWSEPAGAQPAGPPATAAATESSEAEQLKLEGDRAMQRLEYQAALDAYERAYAIDKNPALLYNRGRTLQALGRYPEALQQIEAFDRDAPPELKARVPKLRELVTELKGRVSTLALTSNVRGARVLVRGRLVGTTPLAPIRLNSGAAAIEVVGDGYHPFKHSVTLQGGGQAAVHAVLHSKNTTGVLEITSPIAGADVFVNGSRLGSAPAQTVLKAGEHRVLVRRQGYEEAETTAVILAGRTTRLDVPLDQPPPITARWWFWTGVGVVVVGGIVLTAALLTERDADRGDIPPGQVSGPLLSF